MSFDRAQRLFVVIARLAGVAFLALAVWTTPPGDHFWVVAVLAATMPWVVSGVLRNNERLPLPGIGEPLGIWLGLGLAMAFLANADRLAERIPGFPTLDAPYRPGVLLTVQAAAVALAYAMIARRLKRGGWSAARATAVALTSAALTVLGAFASRLF